MTKLNRRDFIKASSMGMGTAILSTGLAGCAFDSDNNTKVEFKHGVASGDPLADRLIIWTRVSVGDNSEIAVGWEVFNAETDEMVVSGSAFVNSRTDHTVKVDILGLQPGTRYRYYFYANGESSPDGYARTLPAGPIDSAKFAVVSCSNYPAGHFNVYKEVAQQDDIDAVLHLGDYTYEYGMGEYGTERAEEIGRSLPSDNNSETLSLSDYRKRYALYRTDADLQACHASHAMIAVWDDHEVANDAFTNGAENHNDDEGSFASRKLEALKAYFEWMPVRDRFDDGDFSIYRSFQFGDLLDLHMLDTRLIGRDQPINIQDFVDGSGNIDAQAFEAALADSSRTIMGGEQFQWLQGQLAGSSATWQVLGQQVLMGRMFLPAAIATQALSIDQFILIAQVAQIAAIYERYQANDPTLTEQEIAMLTPENLALLEQNQALLTDENIALIQLPNIPYNLDAWDGYAYEREYLLELSKFMNVNLVVLAGDTHNAWANDLKTLSGDQVGVEFATASVSSPGLEDYLQIADRATSAQYEAGITNLVDGLSYCNFYDRGYMLVSFSHSEVRADWVFVDTILSTDYQVLSDRAKSLKARPGQGNRKIEPV